MPRRKSRVGGRGRSPWPEGPIQHQERAVWESVVAPKGRWSFGRKPEGPVRDEGVPRLGRECRGASRDTPTPLVSSFQQPDSSLDSELGALCTDTHQGAHKSSVLVLKKRKTSVGDPAERGGILWRTAGFRGAENGCALTGCHDVSSRPEYGSIDPSRRHRVGTLLTRPTGRGRVLVGESTDLSRETRNEEPLRVVPTRSG